MSASFLITWERLPARPAALAISAPVETSRRRTAGGREFRIPTEERGNQQRYWLSTSIRTLLGLFPSSQVSRAGNCGWLAALHPCALPSAFYHPKDRRGCTTNPTAPRQSFPRAFMAGVSNSCGALRRWSTFPRVHLRQEPLRGFFQRLHRLLCCAVDHLTNSAGLTGLVALCDGHTVSEKEKACPTRDGSNLTQYGARMS